MKEELQDGCRDIMEEYEKQINTIKLNEVNPLTEIEKGIRISKTFIHRLRVRVLEGCISSKEDEIYFFKQGWLFSFVKSWEASGRSFPTHINSSDYLQLQSQVQQQQSSQHFLISSLLMFISPF